jgi:hypothetical protein
MIAASNPAENWRDVRTKSCAICGSTFRPNPKEPRHNWDIRATCGKKECSIQRMRQTRRASWSTRTSA